MARAIKFRTETKTVPFMGGTIEVVSLTPVLAHKERERRRREVEKRLYDVFVKYVGEGVDDVGVDGADIVESRLRPNDKTLALRS